MDKSTLDKKSVTVRFHSNTQSNKESVVLPENATMEEHIIAAMRTVYDPEISVNIYDLGLIYNIQIDDQQNVFVDMTLTSPGCPVAGSLPGQVECAIKAVKNINDAHVQLVWEPPWSRECMSDEARLALGLF